MTSHELARQLLAGPDQPVVLSIGCAKDTITSIDEDGKAGPNDMVDEIKVHQEPGQTNVGVFLFDTRIGYLD